jgi:hypothetical protein
MIASIKVVVKTHKIKVSNKNPHSIIVSQKGTQGPPGDISEYDPGDLSILFSSI